MTLLILFLSVLVVCCLIASLFAFLLFICQFLIAAAVVGIIYFIVIVKGGCFSGLNSYICNEYNSVPHT